LPNLKAIYPISEFHNFAGSLVAEHERVAAEVGIPRTHDHLEARAADADRLHTDKHLSRPRSGFGPILDAVTTGSVDDERLQPCTPEGSGNVAYGIYALSGGLPTSP